MCKSIEELLAEFTDKVWLYETKKPDIVFAVGGKKYALEIETGTVAEHPENLAKKVSLLKKDYGDNWCFVITDYEMSKTYEKLGRVVLRTEIEGFVRELFKKEKEVLGGSCGAEIGADSSLREKKPSA